MSLESPPAPPGSFDPAAADRGRMVFAGAAKCTTCHAGRILSDVNSGTLHAPGETGMDARYAARTTQKAYRTTPLRGLWQHAPYFHDGSAPTLTAVGEHYDRVRSLGLDEQQKQDLVQYLKTL